MRKLIGFVVLVAQLWGIGERLISADDSVLPKTRAKLAAHEPVTIVCLGDSVTGIYYHTGSRRAYPEMIAVGLKQLDAEAKATVINAGISGHTTVNGLARLEKDVLDHQPDLVTVMFGLNDMNRVPRAEFQAHLKTIIDRCRQIGAEVLLCTPNGIIDSGGRPRTKLEDYNAAMKEVGEQTKTPVSDVYSAYETLRASDPLAFRLLCSDSIHPNMDGHKLNAETICRTITGQPVSLKDVGPAQPSIPKTRRLLEAGEPIRVFAMSPCDAWIGPALRSIKADVKVEVTAWETEGKTLNQLHAASKAVRQMSPKPDLVILAIPLAVTPPLSNPEEASIADFTWILNYSLSFGIQEWDVIGVAPSVRQPKLSAEERDRENFARRMILAQDLGLIVRDADNADDAQTIFTHWLKK